jgi:hypothetical protein
MKLTRHVGFNNKSGARISLIMTLLENTEDCLYVYPDNLPENLKEAFFFLMNSDEGQREANLAEVLSRRTYADTRQSILQTLHAMGFIKKSNIDDITMTPSPAYKIPLREVLVQSGLMKEGVPADITSYNPHAYNANAANVGESLGSANNLLVEASMLEHAANEKREQAYRIAPSLRPGFVAPEVENVDFPNTPQPQKPIVNEIEDVDIKDVLANITDSLTEAGE